MTLGGMATTKLRVFLVLAGGIRLATKVGLMHNVGMLVLVKRYVGQTICCNEVHVGAEGAR